MNKKGLRFMAFISLVTVFLCSCGLSDDNINPRGTPTHSLQVGVTTESAIDDGRVTPTTVPTKAPIETTVVEKTCEYVHKYIEEYKLTKGFTEKKSKDFEETTPFVLVKFKEVPDYFVFSFKGDKVTVQSIKNGTLYSLNGYLFSLGTKNHLKDYLKIDKTTFKQGDLDHLGGYKIKRDGKKIKF